MEIRVIDEYNDEGHLIYVENYIGAFVRVELQIRDADSDVLFGSETMPLTSARTAY